MGRFILAIDQGTTSSRALIFDQQAQIVAVAQQEFRQYFPDEGWVEHDATEIWESTLAVCRAALAKASLDAADIAVIGITNQRETTVVWDRKTGAPIYHAIVWQDRRTAEVCRELNRAGHEAEITAKTGLLLDPYFSASKVAWILDHVDGARARAEAGELAFGTVDCWLLWNLTGGASHATDATNASRTQLFNIIDQCWDDKLLRLFNVPAQVLPEVKDSVADFGSTVPGLFGSKIPIGGIAGDQQAALIGQACFEPGSIKSTYGTGCFVMQNTGTTPLHSDNRLLTTIAYRIDGKPVYALEGSIFVAGAAVQWLRDGIGLIEHAEQTEAMAAAADPKHQVYMVPAFTGLGAPWWDPDARGALLGMTRNTGPAEIVNACLRSVCFQTRDLLQAMQSDGCDTPAVLRVDGGMINNNWLLQCLADTLDVAVERPANTETTATGAAMLAGLQCGIWKSVEELAGLWRSDCVAKPAADAADRDAKYRGWQAAVKRILAKPDIA